MPESDGSIANADSGCVPSPVSRLRTGEQSTYQAIACAPRQDQMFSIRIGDEALEEATDLASYVSLCLPPKRWIGGRQSAHGLRLHIDLASTRSAAAREETNPLSIPFDRVELEQLARRFVWDEEITEDSLLCVFNRMQRSNRSA